MMRVRYGDPGLDGIVVTVNGINVTRSCFAADDVEGWADCYKVDDAGHFYCERQPCGHWPERVYGCACYTAESRAATERLTGLVRILLPTGG